MKCTYVVVLLAFCVASLQATTLRQLRDLCDDACSESSQHVCPIGYYCIYNGCGYACCPAVNCDPHCEFGVVTQPNGCPTCQCRSPTDLIEG